MFLYGGSKPYPVSATPTHMLRICVNSPTIAGRRGADPYKIKLKYSQQKKLSKRKNTPKKNKLSAFLP